MALDVYLDTLDIECTTLDTIQPDELNPGPCYPYAILRPTVRKQMLTFRTVVLENHYLRAVIALDLGGRILYLHDKRTGIDVLPHFSILEPRVGGPRGAFLPAGIELMAGHASRLTSMSPVEHQIQFPEDDAPATVILNELIPGTGLGLQTSISLPPNRAELTCDIRLLNRGFSPVRSSSGLRMRVDGAKHHSFSDGHLYYDPERRRGISVLCQPTCFERLRHEGDDLLLFRTWDEDAYLAPRQVDAYSFKVQPVSGLSDVSSIGSCGALEVASDRIKILSSERLRGVKLFLLTTESKTLETTVDLHPEQILNLPLDDNSKMPSAVKLQDSSKDELICWPSTPPMTFPNIGPSKIDQMLLAAQERALNGAEPRDRFEALYKGLDQLMFGDWSASKELFEIAAKEPAISHLAHLGTAMREMRRRNFERADEALEHALNLNAEDPLLWWLKSACSRHIYDEVEERSELINAHFLAPLEPALRAESFLSQEQTHGKEPSPLIEPLSNHPEALIDVACLLLEAGLDEDGARWIDEALRHREVPTLRYLLAWNLLRNSRMKAEAAEMVRIVAKAPIEQPFPWRPLERQAIKELATWFERDERLQKLSRILELAYPKTYERQSPI